MCNMITKITPTPLLCTALMVTALVGLFGVGVVFSFFLFVLFFGVDVAALLPHSQSPCKLWVMVVTEEGYEKNVGEGRHGTGEK